MKKSEVMTTLSVVAVKALYSALKAKYTDDKGEPIKLGDGSPMFAERRKFSFPNFIATMESEEFGTEPLKVLEKYLTFDGETEIERIERERKERTDGLAKITADIGF